MTEDSDCDSGHKYKLSSFLFGNVDKQGQIEEYKNDEDLRAINNIDQCHVKEVEDATHNVLDSADSDLSGSMSEPVPITNSDVTTSADYYDEEEAIPEQPQKPIEVDLHELKPDEREISHLRKLDEEEDYDSPEPNLETKCENNLSTSDSTTTNTSSSSQLSFIPTTSIPVSQTSSMSCLSSDPTSFEMDALESGIPTNLGSSDVNKMPPPLHPAPVAASKQGKICARDSESPGQLSPVPTEMLENVSSPSCTIFNSIPSTGPTPDLLDTPLGSLLPQEYANVPIDQLFPAYDPSRPPRWSSLFRLPHRLNSYGEFAERAPHVRNVIAENQSNQSDRLHLVFDRILDLGQLPTPDEVIEHDEVIELSTPLPPDSDCIAGSPHSWWHRAYKAALSRTSTTTTQKTPGKYDAEPNGREDDGAREKDLKWPKLCGQQQMNGADCEHNSLVAEKQLSVGWRLGPAKYWYDQLGIPLDADITTWTEWKRPTSIPSATTPISQSNQKSTTTCAVQSPVSDDVNFSTSTPVTASTTISDQTLPVPLESPKTPASSVSEFTWTNLYPYQLIDWESDIIYDPQLNVNKISASSKSHAAHAGWIPSQHCRTMAVFQDAYQGKFPYVVGSKALNGMNSSQAIMEQLMSNYSTNEKKVSPTPFLPTNPPYAIFPVENQGILSDSWRFDIIYDSDLPNSKLPPPFLLTLDRNDENFLFDHVDDGKIAEAINSIRDQRQRPQRYATARTASSSVTGVGDEVDRSGEGNKPAHEGPADEEDQWAGGRFDTSHSDPSLNSASLTKPSQLPLNRSCLQVSFGLASTRGMLTGALAKAERGTEKVKMVLGKHGLLAEDDWKSELDRFDDNFANNSGGAHPTVGGVSRAHAALASAAAAVSGIPPKDPLNLSNDEFYALRSGAPGGVGGGLARCGPLQHSTPAVELWPPFFPTYMSQLRLRQFHRVPLKRYLRGPMAQYNVPFPVNNLVRQIQRKTREREEEKTATGGGDIFFMRTPSDLSGADGDMILCEFSEEYPPLMTQVGMASRIINYYRPLAPRDRSLSPAPNASDEPPNLPYGSLVYVGAGDSPFLGAIRPGGCLQTLENNMYRSPVYPHTTPKTDFLVIRNRNGVSIRRVQNIFTVGQEVPLMEVPGPNSKRANNFVRDFLQVFILRLFLRSTDEPKRIKIEEIRKAFPNHSESSVRKRLKVCADFRRTGSDASWWVLRSDYRLPSEEEVRYLVSPEDCCAHYSMLAAELRLKDAGYGEKSLFVADENQEEEEDKEGQPKLEDEVRAAPWNTTRAYLASQRGGCFLELHGVADPTGCGEAFSYSKTSAKPGALFRQAGGEVARGLLKGKKTVTGTDADLRKLHLRDARALLRSFGISEADLKTFKRWEIIDMVRFTSTERAKQGEEEGSAKFARGNRLSVGEQVRCYREECQRIFDLQNRVLSNTELLSSDEEVSSEEDDEDEDEEVVGDGTGRGSTYGAATSGGGNSIGGVRLSSLSVRSFQAVGGRTDAHAQHGQLKRVLESEDVLSGGKRPRKSNITGQISKDLSGAKTTVESVESSAPAAATTTMSVYDANANAAGTILDLAPPFAGAMRKSLRIVRTYTEAGHQYTRTELVPWSPIVEIYLKIRQTRTDEFIHNFVDSDDQFREQQRREKRRLQDQLRRIRKQQALIRERGSSGSVNTLRPVSLPTDPTNRRRRPKQLTSTLIKMRCGACGQTGHMRTNKECPMYGRPSTMLSSSRRSLDRSRLKLPTARSIKRNARQVRSVPRTLAGNEDSDPVAAAQALASRPVSELLAEQHEATRKAVDSTDNAQVDKSNAPKDADDKLRDHHRDDDDDDDDEPCPDFGENDMTVEGTKLKLHSGLTRYIKEQNRRNLKMKIDRRLLDRLNEAAAVVQSANAARRSLVMRSARARRSGLTEDDFQTTIKHKGNRRRIDPRVALNHIFEGIYKQITQIAGSKIFLHPVKEKDFPNYYSQISDPMDLSQIRMKINQNIYTTREEFFADIRLIYSNSLAFNGRYSSYTETAQKMCSLVAEEFSRKESKLMDLESLVNPLLHENDLVGLGYLLQQAVDAMRAVEHSRPFHTPVDKRRYPDYYKVINTPMDLSTLEKLIRDKHFHSRADFSKQVQLIYTNCVTFNGPDSSLTKIAKKLVDVAEARLAEDGETLEAIELNIWRHMKTVTEDAESEVAESISNLSAPASDATHDLSVNVGPSNYSKTTSTSLARKCLKRSAEISRDRKPIKLPRKTTVSDSGSSRALRHRPNDAWYGVDLEYDDDDDVEGQTLSDDVDDAGEAKGKTRPTIRRNTHDDEDGSSPIAQSSPTSSIREANFSRDQTWLTDGESMDATSVHGSPEDHAKKIHPPRSDRGSPDGTITPTQMSPFDQHVKIYERPDSTLNSSNDQHQLSPDEDDDVAHRDSDASVERYDHWAQSSVVRSRSSSSADSKPYVDEDSQFSLTGGLELTDDLVAQDLKLTDSEGSDCLSDEGGELCAEQDLALMTKHGAPSGRLTDQLSPYAHSSPTSNTSPTDHHVAFFIGENEDINRE